MATTVAHAHLAPVELDDAERRRPQPPGTGRPPTWVRRHARRGWPARRRPRVLALVGVQSVLDARERERLEYLADVPGVLEPAARPAGRAAAVGAERRLRSSPTTPRAAGPSARGTTSAGSTCAAPTRTPATSCGPCRSRSTTRCRPAAARSSRRSGCAAPRRVRRRPRGGLRGARSRPCATGGAVDPAARARPGDRHDAGDRRPGSRARCGRRRGRTWSSPRPRRTTAAPCAGTLTATDPATGDVRWRRRTPLGARGPRGAPRRPRDPLPRPT